MKKKILVCILGLTMTAGLLAGCGNNKDNSDAQVKEKSGTETEKTGNNSTEKSTYGDVKAKEKYHFEVIVKSYRSDFWRATVHGAEDEAKLLGVEVNCDGPNSNSDIADQIQMLNSAINSKPDGIGIAASDQEACIDALQAAMEADIPVVCFNSGIPNAPEGSVYATATTDNYAAGEIGAEHLYEAIKDEIKNADGPVRIGEVNQDSTSESVIERGLGFIDKMAELCEADGKTVAVTGNDKYVSDCKKSGDEATADVIIDVKVPSQATSELCATEASVLLNEKDLIAIMGTNQETTEGIITANENLNKLGKDIDKGQIVGVGFDSGAIVVTAVENGVLYGAVTQAPRYQGQVTVDLLVMAANGEEAEDVNTPAYWYDSGNMTDSEIEPNLIR